MPPGPKRRPPVGGRGESARAALRQNLSYAYETVETVRTRSCHGVPAQPDVAVLPGWVCPRTIRPEVDAPALGALLRSPADERGGRRRQPQLPVVRSVGHVLGHRQRVAKAPLGP